MIFRHIEFVKLSPRLILAVFVTQSGLVQNKLVEVDEDLSPRELEKITNYLNQTMTGLSIQDVRTRIITEMAQEKRPLNKKAHWSNSLTVASKPRGSKSLLEARQNTPSFPIAA